MLFPNYLGFIDVNQTVEFQAFLNFIHTFRNSSFLFERLDTFLNLRNPLTPYVAPHGTCALLDLNI